MSELGSRFGSRFALPFDNSRCFLPGVVCESFMLNQLGVNKCRNHRPEHLFRHDCIGPKLFGKSLIRPGLALRWKLRFQ